MKVIEAIITRAWIVFSALVSLFLLTMMGQHNFQYVFEFVGWALIGVPVLSYVVYRLTRFIFHGR